MASTARLDELKKKFDENPRRYFAPLANEHRKSGDLDQAIALCRTHLPQQPAHISGHIVLAQALFEAGSLDEAREIFHTALGLDPENLIALRYLGDIARDANDVETARAWYQRVLEVDPRNEEIVQIVRDLDAPRDEPLQPVAPAPARAEIPAAPIATGIPAEDDARFAPIPIESLELDESLDVPTSRNADAGSVDSSGISESLDVHAEWSSETPTIELPPLDAPDLDPFDLDPAGGADSLVDATADAPAEDFFLTELAGSTHQEADAFDVSEPAGTDPWASSADAAHGIVAETTAAEPEMLDSSAYELPEAPQTAPVAAEVTDASVVNAGEATVQSHADWPTVGESLDAAADDIVVDVSDLAAQPTAEWQTPESEPAGDVASAHAELGLEVMEFVPPSSQTTPSIIDSAPETDPLLGRTPDLAPSSQGATSPSFMTETMAELYLQQGFRNEALAVYRELLARDPSDASLRERVESIERGSMSSLGMANVSETVVESALRRQSARPAKSVRSFFASLAGRRAPMRSTPPLSASGEPEPSTESEYDATEPTYDSAHAATDEPSAEQSGQAEDPAEGERVGPTLSAAETLASFDPFADSSELMDPPAPQAPQADEPESVFGLDGISPMPNAESLLAPLAAPVEPESPSEPMARRSLEDLFPDTPVPPRTEAVAQTLATAFGRGEPQGRPTRAANSELSLDKVFRGAPEGAPPTDGGFSFDQFFSDARPSMGGDGSAPTMSPPNSGRSAGGAGDAHDIEQFTAWLEGLKKK